LNLGKNDNFKLNMGFAKKVFFFSRSNFIVFIEHLQNFQEIKGKKNRSSYSGIVNYFLNPLGRCSLKGLKKLKSLKIG